MKFTAILLFALSIQYTEAHAGHQPSGQLSYPSTKMENKIIPSQITNQSMKDEVFDCDEETPIADTQQTNDNDFDFEMECEDEVFDPNTMDMNEWECEDIEEEYECIEEMSKHLFYLINISCLLESHSYSS